MPYPVLPPPPPPVVTSVVSNQAEYAAPVIPNGMGCLAPPEPSAPESSALLTSSNPTSACPELEAIADAPSPLNLVGIAPSTASPDLSDTPPVAETTDLSSSHLTASYAGMNLSANSVGSNGSNMMSKVFVPTPVNRELWTQEAEQSEDLYYIIETFTPDQLSLPSLQELEQQQPGPAREIITISLDSEPLSLPHGIPVTQTPEFSSERSNGNNQEPGQIQVDGSELNLPPIRPPSEPIPIFVPDPNQPIPDIAPLLNDVDSLDQVDEAENIPSPLDEERESIDDILLEDIPLLEPDSTLENDTLLEDIPLLEPDPTLELESLPAAEDDAVPNSEAGNNDQSADVEAERQPSDPSATDQTPVVLPQNQGELSSTGDALEVTADRQVYDQERQSFLAEGNALMTFRGALLQADRLRVNLQNRVVVAQGNAVLTRGDQIIRGERLEYDLIQDQGSVSNARGEVFIPQTTSDFSPTEQPDILSTAPDIPLSERLANEQPVTTATSVGELVIGGSLSSPSGGATTQDGLTAGTVSRVRFEADEVIFTPDGWEATNVRLTNDPFSPPELEVRSRLVTFRRLDENRSELRARNPRAVLDQGLQIPLFRERAIFDQRDRNPAPFSFGFDDDDRGGFFIERSFNVIATSDAELTLTPQFFAQRAWENSDGMDEVPPDLEDTSSIFDPDLYGLLGDLSIDIGSKTSLVGSMELTSFDLGDDIADENLRGSVRLRRKVFTGLGPHQLTTEYSYRDRLFNGTLGFQTIRRSYGIVLTSPTITLGDSGIQLNYQGGVQRVNADIATERLVDLLPPIRDNNRLTLTRYQVAARLQRFTFLWIGQPLPATPDEGLRYTSRPVVPFVAVLPSVQGVASFYSSGDTQPVMTGSVSLLGQFGHFSRPYLDFLGVNLSYRRSTEGSESPFLFDRENDREVVSGGVTVQLFGPIRVGFQTSLSLSEDQEFDNTFILEYSRRTHGIVARYSPDREQGSINLRISDFDWTGTPEPFGGNPDD
ncbi:MAG: DUF3769 domain-containing protein [Cyanothece sp. SIO2G6]|nr:DUF3769 domain-containing protein [Cyanothece sp. SIO2G6]